MEVMVVVAMMGFVIAMTAPILAATLTRADAKRYAVEAVDALREAQGSVMSGKNNARFGVHFEGAQFILFQGATYVPADSNNVVHSLPGRVTVTSVALTPGGSCTLPAGSGNCDVHFASRKGTPTETGTITFTGDGGETRTVTINAAGMVDVN